MIELDPTLIDRQEAYNLYIIGDMDRDELYEYLHQRIMYLNGFSYENIKITLKQ